VGAQDQNKAVLWDARKKKKVEAKFRKKFKLSCADVRAAVVLKGNCLAALVAHTLHPFPFPLGSESPPGVFSSVIEQ